MKILFVASLHHPEALRATREMQPDVLFPPSMSQHFWEKALKKRGHTLDVFWRNSPGKTTERHSAGITPGKLVSAALNRVPARMHPTARDAECGTGHQSARMAAGLDLDGGG